MRNRGIAAILALVGLGVVLGLTSGAGAGGKQGYEVWVVDQSNTTGTASGGTLLVYDGASLERRGGAAVPERIDLGGATTSLCLERTGTTPVRPHMVFFAAGHSHAVLSFVASGHVVAEPVPGEQEIARVAETPLRGANAIGQRAHRQIRLVRRTGRKGAAQHAVEQRPVGRGVERLPVLRIDAIDE